MPTEMGKFISMYRKSGRKSKKSFYSCLRKSETKNNSYNIENKVTEKVLLFNFIFIAVIFFIFYWDNAIVFFTNLDDKQKFLFCVLFSGVTLYRYWLPSFLRKEENVRNDNILIYFAFLNRTSIRNDICLALVNLICLFGFGVFIYSYKTPYFEYKFIDYLIQFLFLVAFCELVYIWFFGILDAIKSVAMSLLILPREQEGTYSQVFTIIGFLIALITAIFSLVN